MKPTPSITTEVHSYDNDDSLITAHKTSNGAIMLQYYNNMTDYKENEETFNLILTYEFIHEILRVFPCPGV